jgi:hypothetical protein
MTHCLFEQSLVRLYGRRYGLRNVEAVHLKHFAFRACGQSSGLKAGIDEKGVAGEAWRQAKGDGNESRAQI